VYLAKLRSPIGAIFLGWITLGIYYLYWFYKVNEEAAILNDDDNAKPGLSLLAVTLGWFLIIPPFWSHWTTAKRVGRATGRPPRWWANILCSILFLPLLGIVYVIWVQGKLNRYGRKQRAQAHHSVMATSELQSIKNWN
jgi:Domain of unknown function (DUF4234)